MRSLFESVVRCLRVRPDRNGTSSAHTEWLGANTNDRISLGLPRDSDPGSVRVHEDGGHAWFHPDREQRKTPRDSPDWSGGGAGVQDKSSRPGKKTRAIVQRRQIMKSYKAKDLMIPFSECVSVSEDASLYDATRTLDAVRRKGDSHDFRLRLILVYDHTFSIVGWLRQPQVLKALEPKYREIEMTLPESDSLTRVQAALDVMEKYNLWNEPIETIAERAREIRVKDVMSRPGEDEVISEETPVVEAIHRMLMGNHMSPLVKGKTGFPGILRLSDLYSALNNETHSCFTGKRADAAQRR